jgi:hypothetical protein
MNNSEFVDYYELLEVSSNANSETIEKIFRYLATRYHPDVCGTGDKARFNQMIEAYNTLRVPESRVAYDIQFRQHQQHQAELVSESEAANSDGVDRYRLLTLFYAQRKRDMKAPGVGAMKLAQTIGCPMEVVEFYIWYFREKGWVKREDSGLLAITAEGVDEIESRNEQLNFKDRFITDQSCKTREPVDPNAGPTAGNLERTRTALAN